jgi:hypothetical protein
MEIWIVATLPGAVRKRRYQRDSDSLTMKDPSLPCPAELYGAYCELRMKGAITCCTLLACWWMLLCQPARAEEQAQHAGSAAPPQTLVFGFGGAADVDLDQGSSSLGINVFVEYTLIAELLEVEFGASSLALKTGRELAFNLFLKTPIWSRRDLDVSVAAGPELVQFTGMRDSGNYPGMGIAIDVMYWPQPHFGFYIEPTYEFVFRHGTETALDLNAGILIGW